MTLSDAITLPESIYEHYVYSYPHKTAYRPLEPTRALKDVWADEDCSNLFLYLHIPFCEFRCGFCNLFTRVLPPAEIPDRFISQLETEAQAYLRDVENARFSQIAIGGGTPTFLNLGQLECLFSVVEQLAPEFRTLPQGIECSPATITRDKIDLLLTHGIKRISMGVQSFSKRLCNAMGRPQEIEIAQQALTWLRQSNLQTLNVDLIYGVDGQTVDDFLESIRELLHYQPEEIFLYPLYIRPLTGLGKAAQVKAQQDWDRRRLDCYRAGRDYLLANGYHQHSMRMFSKPKAGLPSLSLGEHSSSSREYTCQNDGMVGLGCGARSYTKALHYSSEYAVGRSVVHAIIDAYIARSADSFRFVHYGFELDQEEQMRRFLLMSLLQVSGLEIPSFEKKFRCELMACFPSISILIEQGLAEHRGTTLVLTPAGVERSDQIGPALFSRIVMNLMDEYLCV